MRLGEAEAAELLAARERLQVALLLRVGAERVDRPADDRVLHADDRRRRAVAGGDLLQRDGERHVVEPGAAPALGHDDAERAQRAQRAQLLAREVVLAIPARGVAARARSCANARIVSRISACSSVSSIGRRIGAIAARDAARHRRSSSASFTAMRREHAAEHPALRRRPAPGARRASARTRAAASTNSEVADDGDHDLRRAEHERLREHAAARRHRRTAGTARGRTARPSD